ncbi:hypothetical protein A2V82_05885 [candidate division KSB1 bacterium RBG_16_48_16]|nr:MAG: hypothetical protein A2V82_05885 [candidate division KSB1 bacterium RBG_16_48_16]
MAKVVPLRGLRPKKEFVDKVASPPYDVLDSDEARHRAAGNPYSFLHVIKPEIDLDPSIDPYNECVYQKGRENLRRLIHERVLVQDEQPHFYVYKQTLGTHEQTGIFAGASVPEYLNGRIKKHEHTQPEKVKDRIQLAKTLKAQTGPVFLTLRDTVGLAHIFQNVMAESDPVYNFIAGYDVRHTLWVVKDMETNDKIQWAFRRVENLYIADGHHRSETAAQVFLDYQAKAGPEAANSEYASYLAVLFPHTELLILPYNRVIKDLNGLGRDEVMDKISASFIITELAVDTFQPTKPRTFGMYLDKKWFMLEFREVTYAPKDPVDDLDVTVLHRFLFEPVLHIADQKTDDRVRFVGGMDGMEKMKQLVDNGEFMVAFALYPTEMEQVMQIADASQVMPPKSTWFEPKLLSGLVTHLLE